MSKPSLIIVLLEDDHQQMLIYKYLIHRGLKGHEIRIHRSPSGQGSAESWVRKEFVKETKAYRGRKSRAQTALIVMIDADALTVQDRLNQLDQALRESGNEIVLEGEHVARLIPKRNVETWILCLNEEAVDEGTDYKRARNDWATLISKGTKTLCEWTRSPAVPPNHCVNSLRTGVRELKRLIA
jgi:hypothetical protein